jgi:ParB family transcriptional regulator, chromosome partitioning protein
MPQAKKMSRTQAKINIGESPSKVVSIQSIQMPKKEQPRRYFAVDKMAQLVASIHEHGILEPLIVRPAGRGKYELVAGERRLRAANEIGLSEVPVVVREFSDQQAYEVSLLENLQRDDLNPIDETEGLIYLLCQALQFSSKDELASLLNRAANAKRRNAQLTDTENEQLAIVDQLFLKVGRLTREGFRVNRLPLLNMPEDVLNILRKGELEYTKAQVIARLDNAVQRQNLLREAIAADLSLAQIKQKIQEMKSEKETASGQKLRDSFVSLSKRNSNAWHDKAKQKALIEILSKMEALLQG